MVPLSVFLPHFPIEVHRKRDVARKELKTIFDRVIQQRRASGVREPDLLQHFIESKSLNSFSSSLSTHWKKCLQIHSMQ